MAGRLAIFGMSAAMGAMAQAAPVDDPLLRPVAPDRTEELYGSQPPAHIFGNSYLVGFRHTSVGLIRTSAGLILIDGAALQVVPQLEANIRKLGFRLSDVKLILSTEPHWDHAGGLAALTRDTGATVVASRAAAASLKTGRATPGDPQYPQLDRYPGVQRLRIVADGERVRLGDVAVQAVATPGHTPGSMSWAWRSCEGRRCVNMLFASSINPIAADGYRFSAPGNRAALAAFRGSIARLRAWPCGMLLSAHPDNSGGDRKIDQLLRKASPNPFFDPGACRAYADRAERALNNRIAEENKNRNILK